MSETTLKKPSVKLSVDGDRLAKARANRPKVNPNETPADKFRRLAARRLAHAEKWIRKLIPLGNRSAYSSTDEQVATIMAVLAEAMADVEDALVNKTKDEAKWTL